MSLQPDHTISRGDELAFPVRATQTPPILQNALAEGIDATDTCSESPNEDENELTITPPEMSLQLDYTIARDNKLAFPLRATQALPISQNTLADRIDATCLVHPFSAFHYRTNEDEEEILRVEEIEEEGSTRVRVSTKVYTGKGQESDESEPEDYSLQVKFEFKWMKKTDTSMESYRVEEGYIVGKMLAKVRPRVLGGNDRQGTLSLFLQEITELDEECIAALIITGMDLALPGNPRPAAQYNLTGDDEIQKYATRYAIPSSFTEDDPWPQMLEVIMATEYGRPYRYIVDGGGQQELILDPGDGLAHEPTDKKKDGSEYKVQALFYEVAGSSFMWTTETVRLTAKGALATDRQDWRLYQLVDGLPRPVVLAQLHIELADSEVLRSMHRTSFARARALLELISAKKYRGLEMHTSIVETSSDDAKYKTLTGGFIATLSCFSDLEQFGAVPPSGARYMYEEYKPTEKHHTLPTVDGPIFSSSPHVHSHGSTNSARQSPKCWRLLQAGEAIRTARGEKYGIPFALILRDSTNVTDFEFAKAEAGKVFCNPKAGVQGRRIHTEPEAWQPDSRVGGVPGESNSWFKKKEKPHNPGMTQSRIERGPPRTQAWRRWIARSPGLFKPEFKGAWTPSEVAKKKGAKHNSNLGRIVEGITFESNGDNRRMVVHRACHWSEAAQHHQLISRMKFITKVHIRGEILRTPKGETSQVSTNDVHGSDTSQPATFRKNRQKGQQAVPLEAPRMRAAPPGS
ncbi:hypothetical protein C8R46DRAFT_1040873 [Mycena filopes]|nr:hypothetical protein C8R46DRAFT_1040873 [Mycena filopes]